MHEINVSDQVSMMYVQAGSLRGVLFSDVLCRGTIYPARRYVHSDYKADVGVREEEIKPHIYYNIPLRGVVHCRVVWHCLTSIVGPTGLFPTAP